MRDSVLKLAHLLILAVLAACQNESTQEIRDFHLLDPRNSTRIQFACPRNTFCLPRTHCSLHEVFYDREWLRFSKGPEFEDEFACGAFKPTETLVCCSSVHRLESDFMPTPTRWFFLSEPELKEDVIFPAMLPWLNYTLDLTMMQTERRKLPHLTEEDKSFLNQLSMKAPLNIMPRSTSEEPPKATANPVSEVRPPMMVPVNPWGMPMMPFPYMFMPPFYPPFMMMSNGQMINPFLMGQPSPFLQPPRPPTPPPFFPHIEAFTEFVTKDPMGPGDNSIRTRRSTLEDNFVMPKSSGGLWTNQTLSNDVEGRVLPAANQFIGGQGSFFAIPPAYNINNERCGLSSRMGINARITPGHRPGSNIESETAFAEYPWHVAIVNGENSQYLCAGVLISARHVLTVAHCVRKFQFTYLLVRIGDWDLATRNEMLPSYDAEVANIDIHEEFYAGNLQNDIALLTLKYPLDFGRIPHVGTLCLPVVNGPVTYSNCIVTGWGQQLATAEAKGDTSTFSRVLKQANQQIVPPDQCTKALRPFLGPFYQFPAKGFVCAYDKDGKDSCFGDGGGALACLVDADGYSKRSQYHVVGLVSWGVGCGLPGVPSAYTAVWDYLDWIRMKVGPMNTFSDNILSNNPNPILIRSNPATESPTSARTADFIDLAFT